MPLLNYTTEIPATKSIAEIMTILQMGGATAIMLENGPDRTVSAVSFMMDTAFGRIPFAIPANVAQVLGTINAQIKAESAKLASTRGFKRKITLNLHNNRDQAERIAWRIAKDWLEAQMAIVTIGSAKLEQIMLPFAQIGGRTFYQHMLERGTLALPARSNDDAIPVGPA